MGEVRGASENKGAIYEGRGGEGKRKGFLNTGRAVNLDRRYD